MNELLSSVRSALERRGFEARVFASAKDAAAFILSDIPAGASAAVGGSMTVREMDLHTALRGSGHEVFWHWEAAPQDKRSTLMRALCADCYLASANAITSSGVIVQIDGTGNRVGALCYGPQTVYLIAGSNKIVCGGVSDAVRRIKQIACPKNAQRLGLDTPCAKTGRCDESACEKSMCSVTASFERAPGGKRTVVLLVSEELGY